MKTTLGLFLGALLALSLAGCGDGNGNSGGSGGTGGTGGTGGSTGGTGGTGGSTGGTGGTGGSVDFSCDAYCAELAANCSGDVKQYDDDAACKGICANFVEGNVDDQSGATLGCRLYHGGAPAADAPGTHCPHAGPLGSGVCGEDCDNFCSLAVAVCSGQDMPPYANKDECMTSCMAYTGTDTVPYNAAATSGDSLACRMYHLTVAAKSADSAMTHCPHVAKDSAVCN